MPIGAGSVKEKPWISRRVGGPGPARVWDFSCHRRGLRRHESIVGGTAAPRLALTQVSPVHEAAHRFSSYLRELERRLQRLGGRAPSQDVKEEAATKFWAMIAAIQRAVGSTSSDADWETVKREVREILGAWLWRSDHFNR